MDGGGTATDERVRRSAQSQRDHAARMLAMWSEADRGWKPLLRVVRSAVSLAWKASPGRLTLLALLSVTGAGGLTAQVLAGRTLFDRLLIAGGTGAWRSLAGPLLVIGVVSVALKVSASVTAVQSLALNMRMQAEAEAEILKVAATVPLEVFEDTNFHENLQRATVSVTGQNELVAAVTGLAGGILSAFAMASLLATIRPALLPLMLAATTIEVVLAGRAARNSYAARLRLVDVDLRTRAYRGAIFWPRYIQDVHAYDLLEHLDGRRFDSEHEQIAEIAAVSARNTRVQLAGAAVAGLCTVAAAGVLLVGVRAGTVGVASAAAALVAFTQGRRWLKGIGASVNGTYEAAVMLGAYDAFVRLGREVGAERPTTPMSGPFERLSVRDVSFAYPGAESPALDGVSLDIAAGEVVALVGENGSGKTTLAKLLANLYVPTSGAVEWDGIDIATRDPATVRDHVAVIFQDFSRYRLTARENIGFGRWPDLSDEERLRRAAAAAGIDDVLAGLSHGYDTFLTNELEPGTNLSGGQWQRVALARGFFRDAQLLVLDEPTSALDARAEKDLFDRIRELARGRTVLLISHRFSTVRNADRIMVLHEGRVAEQGSHDELMSLCGRYAELFTLQAAAYLEASADEGCQRPHVTAGEAAADDTDDTPEELSRRSLRDVAGDYLATLGDEPPPGWRDFPRLLADALRICLRGGPVKFPAMVALTVLGSVATALQVLVVRDLGGDVLTIQASDNPIGLALSALLLVGALGAAARICTELVAHHDQTLPTAVLAYAESAVLGVGGAVPLEVHEDSRYYARVDEAMWALLRNCRALTTSAVSLAGGAVGVLVLAALLVPVQPQLLAVLVAGSVVEIWLGSRTTRYFHAAQRELTPVRQGLEILRDMLTSRDHAKEVHSFDLHDPLADRWRRLTETSITTWTRVNNRTQRGLLQCQMVGSAVSGIGFLVLIRSYTSGAISLATAAAAALAYQQTRARMQTLGTGVVSLHRAAAFHRVHSAFVQLKDRIDRERPTGSAPESFAELRLRNVSFAYPAAQKLALDNVSTTIRAGQVVAVVGENGSGKTTLAKILAHLFTPTSGALYWDGSDTGRCDPERLRSKVAVVFQDFSLFEVPLRDNIGYGNVEHVDDLDRVRRAAAQMGIDRMAESLPSGYGTIISPRMGDGIDLSGGQRQRVALARAFFREPQLLVLDEPTSALDAKAEKRLFDQIQAMAADRTVVFVSHRFTSVRAADHIIVLQSGRVVDQGTHVQLMANRGHYYDLFTLQAAAYLDLNAAGTDAT